MYRLIGPNEVKFDVGNTMPHYDAANHQYVTDVGAFFAQSPGDYTVRHVADPTMYPELSAMQFYLSFTGKERVVINELVQANKDKVFLELWRTFTMARDRGLLINPNLPSLQEGLAYMALPADQGGLGVITSSRIPDILAGKAQ